MMTNSEIGNSDSWSQYAKAYDPIKIGSIDGTDTEPHDKAIVRAANSKYWPNRHVKGKPECTIFVARLSPKTTKDTIKDIFSKYGRLRRFRLVKDIVTGFPKGYAFIEYEQECDAEEAYKNANKTVIDGQAIFVDFECERLLKGWKPRRLGGGFGGRKESGQLRFGGRDRPFKKPIHIERLKRDETKRHSDHYANHDNRSDGRDKDRCRRSLDKDRRNNSIAEINTKHSPKHENRQTRDSKEKRFERHNDRHSPSNKNNKYPEANDEKS